MRKILISVGIPVLLIMLAVWAILGQLKLENYITQPVKNLKTAQRAAVHLGYPNEDGITPHFDPAFDALSSFTRVQIPIADRFDSPMGTEQGGFIYNAQGFNLFILLRMDSLSILGYQVQDGVELLWLLISYMMEELFKLYTHT